jgi:hypothetical protein
MEHPQTNPVGHSFIDCGDAGGAEINHSDRLKVDERTAAKIIDERDAIVASERCELPRRRRRGEATDRLIARRTSVERATPPRNSRN